MGANGRWAGTSSRWAIAVAAVVLLAAGLLALSSGGGDRPPGIDPVPLVQSSDPTASDQERGSGSGDRVAQEQGAGGEPTQPPGNDEQPQSSASGSGPGDGQPAPEQGGGGDPGAESEQPPVADCPPGLTADQCRAAGESLAAGGSRPYDADDCPPGFTADQCRAAGEAFADAGSHPFDADDCPPGFTADQCRAAGEALRGGG